MKKRIIWSIFSIVLLLGACQESAEEPESKENNKVNETERKQKFRSLPIEVKAIPDTLSKGDIIEARRWLDENGENLLILSIVTTEEEDSVFGELITNKGLFVSHYKKEYKEYVLVRKVKDFQQACMLDNLLEFCEMPVSITDLDTNGYAEVIFVYRNACLSDVSPQTMKLILLENGEKYAIRGTTQVVYDKKKGYVGGEMHIDKLFEALSPRILKYAKQQWTKAQNRLAIPPIK